MVSVANTADIPYRRNTTASTTSATRMVGTPDALERQLASQAAPATAPATVEPVSYTAAPAYTPPPPIPTSADALNTPDYLAADAALRNALELFRSEQEANKNRYGIDYEQAVRNLGWIPDSTNVDGLTASGRWDEGDLLTSQGRETASGRAFSNQLNDFASRGLLQSGLFAAQRNALQNELTDRLKSTEQSRARFMEDLTTKERNFMAEQERARLEALNNARQGLMNQYLAQYGGA